MDEGRKQTEVGLSPDPGAAWARAQAREGA